MAVKLEWYRIFHQVALMGSFSKAAENLYITQSAVSQSISQLEIALDTKLFTRHSKGISLTESGRVMFEYVDSAIGLLDNATVKIEKMKKLSFGEIKIAANDTLCKDFLLPYLEKFHYSYPAIHIEVINRTTSDSVAKLKSGSVDVVLANLPVKDKTLDIIPCKKVTDIFVAGKKFRFLQGRPLSVEEIAKFPLIMLQAKANSRQYVGQFFLNKGINIKPDIELSTHSLLVEFAKINLGVACVTKEFVSKEIESGDLIELSLRTPIPPREIGICTLKGVNSSLPTREFIHMITKK